MSTAGTPPEATPLAPETTPLAPAPAGRPRPTLQDVSELYTPNVRPRRLMVRGEGVWLWDDQGRRYLDLIAGIGVSQYGHGHPEILRAVREQAGRLMHHSNLYTSKAPLALAAELVEHSFAERVLFTNSGTETIEAAIKLARSYFRRVRGEDRFEIVAAQRSFHGRSLGALACTGNPRYQKGFEPLAGGVRHVPYGDVDALRAAAGPATAAILLEPIQGEAGVVVPPAGYLSAARGVAEEAGCLLIFDEIQTGIGRTGRLFAHEHEAVTPDVLACAKGLGAGLPLGALLTTAAVAAGLPLGSHGTTMGGNPVACAAGLAGLRLLHGGLLRRSEQVAAGLRAELEELAERHPAVVSVRGRGLMLGVLLHDKAQPVVARALELGLLVNSASSAVVRLLPPLILDAGQAHEGVRLLERALGE